MPNFTLKISDKSKKKSKIKVNITRLSHITGYSKSHISRVFSKQTRPSVDCLSKLAEALGVSLGDLHSAIQKGGMNVGKAG